MKIIWLIFFLLPLNLAAQHSSVDKTSGKIYFAEEVLVMDGPKTDLYHRAKGWFASAGNKKVLCLDDAANGVLKGSGYYLLSDSTESKGQHLKLWYSVKIEMEDDRYWYRFSDFKIQYPDSSAVAGSKYEQQILQPLEAVLFSEISGNAAHNQFNKSLEDAVHKSILRLIKELKAGML